MSDWRVRPKIASATACSRKLRSLFLNQVKALRCLNFCVSSLYLQPRSQNDLLEYFSPAAKVRTSSVFFRYFKRYLEKGWGEFKLFALRGSVWASV